MESAAVQVHSQVAKAANAMDRAQIRIMLIAGIAAWYARRRQGLLHRLQRWGT